MEKPLFRITPKKYTKETSVISMRIPKDMLQDIDAAADASGRTRNEVLSLCLEFALEHMEISSTNK